MAIGDAVKVKGLAPLAAKIDRIDAEAIWHILTKNEPFAPAGPAMPLVA